jgi:hypothetical protein
VVGEKLTNEFSVTGCIVVMENRILHAPQIQSLSLNVLPLTPQTQVSSPVMILDVKDGLSAVRSWRSWHTATRCSFCSGVSSRGTNLAVTGHMFNSDIRIVCTDPYDTNNISNVVDHPPKIHMHKFPIRSTFLGVMLVEGLPDRSSSSRVLLPPLKRLCHSKHCV